MSSKKIEMFDKYPFNQLVVSDVSNLLILQRIKLEERLDIQKILMLRGLKHHYLIKLKSVKNEEGCIVLAYEYVPTSLEIWVNDKNDEQIA